jgi:hypothetical protein
MRKSILDSEKPYTWHGLFLWKKHPLCIAVLNNNLEEVQRIIKAGENVGIGDNTPLLIACERGYKNIVEVLLDEWNINSCYPKGKPLLLAIKNGHLDICLLLFTKDDSYTKMNWYGVDYQKYIKEGIAKYPNKKDLFILIQEIIKETENFPFLW